MTRTLPLICLALLFLGIQGGIYRSSLQIPYGDFCDPDCYQRLNRVEHLAASGSWFDEKIPGSDAPYGESSHWARPLDLILLAGALPLQPLLGFKQALFWSGVWFGPVLQALSVLLLAWAAAPLLKPFSRMHLAVFFLSQPALIGYYVAGRPDHHSLLMSGVIVVMGLLIRLLQCPERRQTAFLLGLMHAVLLWVSVETLVISLLTQMVLGFCWLEGRPGFTRVNRDFSWAQLVGIGVVLLLETPDHFLRTDVFDRLCFLHVLLFTAVALYWTGLVVLEQSGPVLQNIWQRLGMAFCGTLFCVAVVWRVAPDVVNGPFAHIDPRMARLWLKNVKEVQPLAENFRGLVTGSFTWMWMLWIVGPWAVWQAFKDRSAFSPGRPLLFFLMGAVVFAGLTIQQIRWASYTELMLLVPATLCLTQVLDWMEVRLRPDRFRPARLLLLLLFAAGYLPVAVLLSKPEAPPNKTVTDKNNPAPSVHQLCDWLKAQPFFECGKQRILAQLDMGPELLYRTGAEVVASPYHRNSEGVLFGYDVMTSEDLERSKRMLKERGITLLLLNLNSPEKGFYGLSGHKQSLYQKLIEGQIPGWLEEISLPKTLNSGFRLYKIR